MHWGLRVGDPVLQPPYTFVVIPAGSIYVSVHEVSVLLCLWVKELAYWRMSLYSSKMMLCWVIVSVSLTGYSFPWFFKSFGCCNVDCSKPPGNCWAQLDSKPSSPPSIARLLFSDSFSAPTGVETTSTCAASTSGPWGFKRSSNWFSESFSSEGPMVTARALLSYCTALGSGVLLTAANKFAVLYGARRSLFSKF